MNESRENLMTIVLILVIIIVFLILGIFCCKVLMTEDTDDENIVIQESYKNKDKVINNTTKKNENVLEGKKIDKEEEEEQDQEKRVENIYEMFNDTNIQNVNKYIEDGIIKTEVSKIEKNALKNKMVYNYNFNEYNAEFVYPKEWGVAAASVPEEVIQCYEYGDTERVVKAVIGEIDISEYNDIDYDTGLEILESKIKEHIQEAGRIYAVSNFNIEEIEKNNLNYKILKYNYDGLGDIKYCYSIIEIGYPHIYVLTISIPEELLNDDNIELKDDIIKTYKIYKTN